MRHLGASIRQEQIEMQHFSSRYYGEVNFDGQNRARVQVGIFLDKTVSERHVTL